MHELQPWVSSIIALAGAVAVIATLRSDSRHSQARLESLEKKVEKLTPRAAVVDALERDVAGLREGMTELRIAFATRAPTSPTRRHRTPPTGVPVRRDSDTDET